VSHGVEEGSATPVVYQIDVRLEGEQDLAGVRVTGHGRVVERGSWDSSRLVELNLTETTYYLPFPKKQTLQIVKSLMGGTPSLGE
jgi:hypothetical protein